MIQFRLAPKIRPNCLHCGVKGHLILFVVAVMVGIGISFIGSTALAEPVSTKKVLQWILQKEELSAEQEDQIRQWAIERAAFETQLDQAIVAAMREYVQQSYEETVKSSLTPEQLGRLNEVRADFLSSLPVFGSQKDYLRFNAFHAYHKVLEQIFSKDAVKQSLWKKISLLWNRVVSVVRSTVILAGPYGRMIWASFVKGMQAGVGTPTTTATMEVFSQQAILQGFHVELEGALVKGARPSKPQEVNVIVANHVSAAHDPMVVSALGLKSYLTFGALNLDGQGIFALSQFRWAQILLKRLESNRDLILVGRGQGNSLQRLVQSVLEGRSSNIFLFPQGMVSAGFDETLPLRPDFSTKLLSALIRADLHPNLQIITLPDHFQFTGGTPADDFQEGRLRGYVEEPLQQASLQRLIKIAGPRAVDWLIRGVWIERIAETRSNYNGLRQPHPLSCMGVL